MNYFKKGFIVIVIIILRLSGLQAQDVDKERTLRIAEIEQSIRYLEGTLGEMFQTKWKAFGNNVEIADLGRRSGRIKGYYIEDYGVIFIISGGPPALVKLTDSYKNKAQSFTFTKNGEQIKVSEEEIIERIITFLSDYGSVIGELRDDEKVTVVYDNNVSRESNILRFLSSNNKKVDEKRLPTIHVTAKKPDLARVRKETISRSQFENLLQIERIEQVDAKKRDIKIFANILKTTFEETDDDAFKIRGNVNYTYVKEMGSLFYLDTSYGSVFGNLDIALRKLETKLSNLDFDSLKTGSLSLNNLDSSDDDKTEKRSREFMKKAYQHFIQQLKETIVDYGGTLKSVQSDEKVFISVTSSDVYDGVKSQFTLSIKKSMLEALDNGTISREEAMKQINNFVIHRYGNGERSYSIPFVPVHH